MLVYNYCIFQSEDETGDCTSYHDDDEENKENIPPTQRFCGSYHQTAIQDDDEEEDYFLVEVDSDSTISDPGYFMAKNILAQDQGYATQSSPNSTTPHSGDEQDALKALLQLAEQRVQSNAAIEEMRFEWSWDNLSDRLSDTDDDDDDDDDDDNDDDNDDNATIVDVNMFTAAAAAAAADGDAGINKTDFDAAAATAAAAAAADDDDDNDDDVMEMDCRPSTRSNEDDDDDQGAGAATWDNSDDEFLDAYLLEHFSQAEDLDLSFDEELLMHHMDMLDNFLNDDDDDEMFCSDL